MKVHRTKRIGILLLVSLLCFVFQHTAGQTNGTKRSSTLAKSTPEAEGVSSAAITRFLEAVDNGKNELHSFVIVRHGKIISEGWWNPYGKDLNHVMFSVSKSFTSTGIGLAIAENKLKLSDEVISFFPESLPDTVSSQMKKMTVRDLLMMSAGMNTDPLFTARGSSDWPKAFMSAAVENEPGSVFKYNNMATFMLSAIVQKSTGEKLVDYLKPRLFEPLEIKNVSWDETPGGYTFGAIGLKLKSEDMAKFGQLLLQKGNWNGKQIIPAPWVEEATSFKIESQDPGNKRPKELNDWAQGYCYQFWRCRHNAFRADGLGGQFIVVMPEQDAVVVLTASAADTQEELNLVWDYLLPAMHDKPLPENKEALKTLERKISSLSTAKGTSSPVDPKLSARLSEGKIEFAQNEVGIQAMNLVFGKDGKANVLIQKGNEQYQLAAALDRFIFSDTKLTSLTSSQPPNSSVRPDSSPESQVATKYTWTDESTLELTAKFVEQSIWSDIWVLHFEQQGSETRVGVEVKGRQPRTFEGRLVVTPR